MSSILEFLYESPTQQSTNDLPLPFKHWSSPKNESIYVLSRVCRTLAEYTYPLRFRCVRCNSPIDLRVFINILFRSETLRQSVRYLILFHRGNAAFIQEPYFLDAFPALLPNLFALQITIQGDIDIQFMTRLASCANLRHLTLTCQEIFPAAVPDLANLHLWTLQINLYNHIPEETLPIQTILSGQSSSSLREIDLSSFTSNVKRYHLRPSSIFPLGVTLRGLRSLSFQDAVVQERDTFTHLSHLLPNLETLSVQLRGVDVCDPDASGSWPSLERAYIGYSTRVNGKKGEADSEKLLYNAPALSKVFLQKISLSAFVTLCRGFSLCGVTNIRDLKIEIALREATTLSLDHIRDLAPGLALLENLTLIAYDKDQILTEKRLKLQSADAAEYARGFAGFANLRSLDWNVDISTTEDPYIHAHMRNETFEWMNRNKPLYTRAMCAIASACPRMLRITWRITMGLRWTTGEFDRGDDGSVSDLNLVIQE